MIHRLSSSAHVAAIMMVAGLAATHAGSRHSRSNAIRRPAVPCDMTRICLLHSLLALALSAFLRAPVGSGPETQGESSAPSLTKAQWREDLRHLARELPKRLPTGSAPSRITGRQYGNKPMSIILNELSRGLAPVNTLTMR